MTGQEILGLNLDNPLNRILIGTAGGLIARGIVDGARYLLKRWRTGNPKQETDLNEHASKNDGHQEVIESLKVFTRVMTISIGTALTLFQSNCQLGILTSAISSYNAIGLLKDSRKYLLN